MTKSKAPKPKQPKELSELLQSLMRAGEHPSKRLYNRIAAHGQAAVTPLIEIALDKELYDVPEGDRRAWAPIHAVQLLGNVGAVEALDALLQLTVERDDEELAYALAHAFAGIGAPAIAPLSAIMADHAAAVAARQRAVDSLCCIARVRDEARAEVVAALVRQLAPEATQVPDDEVVNGAIVLALSDLKATEAAAAVQQAFEEWRVYTPVVAHADVSEELGLPPQSHPEPDDEAEGIVLRLKCTACGWTRPHHFPYVLYDTGSMERHEEGESSAHPDIIVPGHVTCPKCAAVDQYELSPDAEAAVVVDVITTAVYAKGGMPVPGPEEPTVRPISCQLEGRYVHPLDAIDILRRTVAEAPDRLEERQRLARVMWAIGWVEEASEQYREVLRLQPADLDAHVCLGILAYEAGDSETAKTHFERAVDLANRGDLPPTERQQYVQIAAGYLKALSGGPPVRRVSPTESTDWRPDVPVPAKE